MNSMNTSQSSKSALKQGLKTARYNPYNNDKDIKKSNNVDEVDIKNCSFFDDLSQCFSDTVFEKKQHADDFESEDLFLDDDSFKDPPYMMQSTPFRKPQIEHHDKVIKDAEHTIVKLHKINEMDPFADSMNISFANLNEMHTKNMEKTILNENTKVQDLSQAIKTSQYKREVLDSFNQCEMTICHLNEELFKDNLENNLNEANFSSKTLLGNNSIWEKTMNEKTEDSSFMLHIPNNFSQLLTSNINAANNSNISESIDRSTLMHVKKIRTPLLGEQCNGDFFGLPPLAKSLIVQYKGIEKLYDWQNECLSLQAIKNRKNLIYALPTSGGKTLVAEILMLREVVCRKKSVLFILPFVSIVQEKVWGLSPFAVGLDFLVEEYAAGKGILPPRKRNHRKSIYIATLEKGLGLVRSMLELNRLNELGLIVVDELHLVGDPSRGCILELLLTNVMYSGEDIQIIGMSATIGNIDELAKFLDAEVFLQDFRPVELKEYVKLNENIFRVNWNAENLDDRVVLERKINFGYSKQVTKIDPDHLGGLVMEVIPKGSCLIFCPTKMSCENVAILLCKLIFKDLLEYRKQEKINLNNSLRAEGTSDESLFSLIKWGVAYHHSGLAAEERRLIEDAFREGILSVICCTSTLAAGVNLPAQRVILRAPLVGKDFISLSTYKQMVGRAGRAGFGGHGESILICPPHLIKNVRELMASSMDKASSNLHSGDGANMRSLILGAIALQTATSRRALRSLLNCSLLAIQAERLKTDMKQLLDKTIETLFKMGAIQTEQGNKNKGPALELCNNVSASPITRKSLGNCSHASNPSSNKEVTVMNDTKLIVSRLGRAAIKGSIELQRAHMLYADLKVAQNGLVLIGVLHLLYLVTPYDLAESIKLNLNNYYDIYCNMDMETSQTAKIIGLNEASAIQMAKGQIPRSVSERVLKRFYITLMLYDLWNQNTLLAVSEKYQINKGFVQNLMIGAATFGSSVMRFCQELEEFWAFTELLTNFCQRLSHFCSLELVPLMELPSVKKSRALQLYRAGFRSLQHVAQANPTDLMESLEHMSKKVANQLIAAAKLLLLEKVENLREEAENVLNGLNVNIV